MTGVEPTSNRGQWVWLELTITDVGFTTDSDPANDTLDLMVKVYTDKWQPLQDTVLLDDDCFIEGAPFAFTRFTELAVSCD